MCAFPKLLRGGTAPRNMGEGWGQCVRGRLLLAGKICRGGQLLPGLSDRNGCRKAWFYWVFLHGTALAEKRVHERAVGRCRCGLVGVPPCYLLWALRHRPSMPSRR